jgi:hypothetical protein
LDLSIRQINATSVLAQWLPPLSTQRNGNITAYQVFIFLERRTQIEVDYNILIFLNNLDKRDFGRDNS